MPDFVLKARGQYTPRNDLGRFIQTVVAPAARAGVTRGTQVLFDATQEFVAVDKGDLKASGRMEIVETEKSIVGNVVYTAGHAAYVEFGTGQRGAETGGDPEVSYSADWPGMDAQPYMRPGLDAARSEIKSGFTGEMSAGLKKGF